jgi:hypothetical protein
MNNYPDGVTGNEYEIAGPDSEIEINDECPNCGELGMVQFTFQRHIWNSCTVCDFSGEGLEDEGPDPDAARDRLKEEGF